MEKDLNEGKFKKKNLMIENFSKMTYIKDQNFFLKNDLYIGPEGVYYNAYNSDSFLKLYSI